MGQQSKNRKVEIFAFVFCAIGCTLFLTSNFIDTEIDLWTIGMALNAVGLIAFVFGRKNGKGE